MSDSNNENRWIETDYLQHLASLFDSNMTYLHTTLNWTVTLLVGGVIVIMSRDSFPDSVGFASLLIMVLVIGHFGVRTAKAYTNIMRWTSIEKHVLALALSNKQEERNKLISLIQQKIRDYHIGWKSPLELGALSYKVFFELGFFYFFLIVLSLITYSIWKMKFELWMGLGIVVTTALLAVELWLGVTRSAYYRRIKNDPLADILK